ncbi:alpha-hydroxy-acid oxidizing protein [Thermaerobacter sp. PB12/4term]|uniref:lactate 2-monooxygenase n=1 Tax=Thermaerobacter sp. PB12/4term TaxID=2293838 RepID=UPI000E32CB8A|nr:lactate 2-monooxygenase [Thermaerobacter sp. PB12/4term]QIA27308.1 alpha-hydroxy-acid oxidizing protein [Thermaerobacter sp. PB12/4term]
MSSLPSSQGNFGLQAQVEIYLSAGQAQRLPVSVDRWREQARAVLSDGPWWYVEGGAGSGATMAANRQAFDRWRLRPRMLRDVAQRDLSTELLGRRLPAPVLLAPVGVLSVVHGEAERAPARAAARLGLPFIASTVSSVTLEGIAEAMGDGPRWFQLYPARDREIMASLIRRAEAAGYEALVVTVDTTMLGWREHDLENAYLPFLLGEGIANYLSDPAFRARLPRPPEEDREGAILQFLQVFVNPSFTWDELAFIRSQSRLPVLVKGITHPGDARQAVECGVQGIIVSNHGGRQVDGAVAALDALPEVVEAVAGRVPVLFDSGIRRGADVLKALALGARAVLVGRPYVYALAAAGEAGVARLLRHLLADLDLTMGLCGVRSVAEIDGSLVTRV